MVVKIQQGKWTEVCQALSQHESSPHSLVRYSSLWDFSLCLPECSAGARKKQAFFLYSESKATAADTGWAENEVISLPEEEQCAWELLK